ncbi:hypothetical protein ASPZODRAFT_62113 [Penicilliopsis zonata CBS 506.65]|uniref:Glycerophosphocholine acyltransferase 1 n=1 Tax=Penicilliopsis zonata CBS 506.65 TaxID=1073090 RepID=A0A1L9SN84_9EURO|nr:hypothetical protein ASPZODRAFT_62113 [Penicilliopsis zonata CBS 506.65]OJJ48561.1 hypothetical protein ASPZODRAFT_62113 [Penicilliopsis zonata CBS 506.65]
MGMLTFGRFLSRPYPHHSPYGPTIFSFQQKLLMDDSAGHRRSKSEVSVAESIESIGSSAAASETGMAAPEPMTPGVEGVDEVASYSPASTPGRLSRNPSFSNSSSYQEDWETFPPLDKLTVFDLFDTVALNQRLEKWQQTLQAQKEMVKRQREKLKSTSQNARQRVVGEWKRRVPTSEEQLEKYRRRMKTGVERLGKQWNKTATVTLREKASFLAGVLNIFISGYLIGACPDYFYYWYTAQLAYFMPIRWYDYHKRGWHYFLADLCYFVNLLSMLSIWVFPNSKRLFISTYCLAFGNNAVAIAMWRNSLVFHSMDKVVSVFIHIMPPAALHCLVHLTPVETLQHRFPAVYHIKFSQPGSPEHYSLWSMMFWATVPYVFWQLSYYLFITVRRRDKIAAGHLTSFTWLRKSYSKTWIGKFVLSLSDPWQEPAFMMIQYVYALLTIIPCPLWFWSRWASSAFVLLMFSWSIHNGATYYIDIFGKRFQKELEELKKDVARWQSSPDGLVSPLMMPDSAAAGARILDDSLNNAQLESDKASLDHIPLLDSTIAATGVDGKNGNSNDSVLRERQ